MIHLFVLPSRTILLLSVVYEERTEDLPSECWVESFEVAPGMRCLSDLELELIGYVMAASSGWELTVQKLESYQLMTVEKAVPCQKPMFDDQKGLFVVSQPER